jgi:hypothetical protein
MQHQWLAIILAVGLGAASGCGTTKWTDTSRTATEQLLIAYSMERAVSRIDFRALAGKTAFVDDTYVKTVTDSAYLVSSIRQQALAAGTLLKEKREEADYVVEVRAGAVGTDRHDVLVGFPQTTIPALVPFVSAGGATIPEIPLVKRTDQRGVTRIAVFAYNRKTGRPVWQSGAVPAEANAKSLWVFGAGPFHRGSIYEGTKFAGDRVNIPLIDLNASKDSLHNERLALDEPAHFSEPHEAPPAKSAGGVAKSDGKEAAPSAAGKAPAGQTAASLAAANPAAQPVSLSGPVVIYVGAATPAGTPAAQPNSGVVPAGYTAAATSGGATAEGGSPPSVNASTGDTGAGLAGSAACDGPPGFGLVPPDRFSWPCPGRDEPAVLPLSGNPSGAAGPGGWPWPERQLPGDPGPRTASNGIPGLLPSDLIADPLPVQRR